MIGSTRKRDVIYRALRETGVAEEQLSSVHSPIGRPIKAETPEEIAVSIVAELVNVRRKLMDGLLGGHWRAGIMNEQTKLARLKEILRGTGGVAVAYSGGVDSTFLAAVARDVLGEGVLAVTLASPLNPPGEVDEAAEMARQLGLKHMIVEMPLLENENIAANPPLRCYYCKLEIMSGLKRLAERHGIKHVVDGLNAGDTGDYRPGVRACRELGIGHPLLEAGLIKTEIRTLSRERGLSTASKPSAACLASRFPYGTRLTARDLDRVGRAELFLKKLGFWQVRVRVHGDLARLEVSKSDLESVLKQADIISDELKKMGYLYVALDLEGYRTGSMNDEILRLIKKDK